MRRLAMLLLCAASVRAQSMAGGGASALIWPAQGDYAGTKKCAICHPAQARSYVASSMSRALEPIESCEILLHNPRMEWSDGAFRYVIEKAGERYRYAVTDGS